MAVIERLKNIRRVDRPWWLAVVACTGAVVMGHFLRQLNIVLNPLAWSSAEIISALLSFTIAASVLVRYYGTGNRISLLLGLTFGVTGIIHLGAIFEFYDDFLKPSEQFPDPWRGAVRVDRGSTWKEQERHRNQESGADHNRG